ncbi:hypothetical protein B9Q03_08830 [Candidatus Marsarchaeota G2 archaeon OSP_D]|uniref:Uncharacterized protein n=1 Tax=Candidatus Marsarchaeota G2 archaeon OSP_D TaxID=1978157 RepID=A0A2R6ARK1_9ARCH|nr:MAG: hypothetical protein B9Q03_08830 [Candidatus Marsarchaeota G2 archaeon OSP_D]
MQSFNLYNFTIHKYDNSATQIRIIDGKVLVELEAANTIPMFYSRFQVIQTFDQAITKTCGYDLYKKFRALRTK